MEPGHLKLAALSPGTRLGRRRVLEPRGRGAYGVVYRAVANEGDGAEAVALKLALHPWHGLSWHLLSVIFPGRAAPASPLTAGGPTCMRGESVGNRRTHTLSKSPGHTPATRPAARPAHSPATSQYAHPPVSAETAFDFSRLPIHSPAPDTHRAEPGSGARETGGGVLQRKALSSTAPAVPPAPPEAASLRAGGAPLASPLRAEAERKFGHDFTQVRIHADAQAATTTRALRAEAFTIGSHIYFASSRFAPESQAGRALLGHELTHVIQQRALPLESRLQRKGSSLLEDPDLEHQADQGGALFTRPAPAAGPSGGFRSPAGQAGVIQRQPAEKKSPSSEGSAWDWLLGVLAGDFEEDPSAGQLVVRTVLTMIPVVDQVGDVEDVAAALYKLIWETRYEEASPWIDLTLSALGLIPEAGSLAKGIIKGIIKGAKKLNLDSLLKLLDSFGAGKRLDDLVRKVEELIARMPELGRMAGDRLRRLLDDFSSKLDTLLMMARLVSDKAVKKLEELRAAARAVRERIEKQVAAAVEAIQKELAEALARLKGQRVDAPGGKSPKGIKSPADAPAHYQSDPGRLESLSKDPAKGGAIDPHGKSTREAMAGLEAEQKGLLKPPIKRGPAEVDFFDGDGVPWDVKTPVSPGVGEKWTFAASKPWNSISEQLKKSWNNDKTGASQPVRVLLDASYMSKADHELLWQNLKKLCTAEQLSRIVEVNARV